MHAEQWKNVNTLRTKVRSQGISQTMVTIWKPGNDRRALIDDTLALLLALWRRESLTAEVNLSDCHSGILTTTLPFARP